MSEAQHTVTSRKSLVRIQYLPHFKPKRLSHDSRAPIGISAVVGSSIKPPWLQFAIFCEIVCFELTVAVECKGHVPGSIPATVTKVKDVAQG